MEITYIPISKLKPNERNPRKIVKEQFEKLCNDIQDDPEFLEMRPCLVSQTENGMIVYAGNQRLRAAKKLGMKEVPCIIKENVPQETIKKRIIRDNVHRGEHDFDILTCDYEVDELLNLGMLEKDLGMAINDIEDVEEKPEKKKKLKTCPHCGCEF